MDPQQPQQVVQGYDQSLYDKILGSAALPILLLLILLSWFIINRLMSPKWRQAKRNKQILKARAERQALMEEMAENASVIPDKTQRS